MFEHNKFEGENHMKLLTWVFAIIGVLGLFDWMFAKGFLKVDPDNKFAQDFSAPWVLYVSLTFMTLGLFFAWVSGPSGRRPGA